MASSQETGPKGVDNSKSKIDIYALIEQSRERDDERPNEKSKNETERTGRIRHDELDSMITAFEQLKSEDKKERLKFAYELALDGVLDYIEGNARNRDNGFADSRVTFHKKNDILKQYGVTLGGNIASKSYLEKVLKLRNLSHEDQMDIDTFGKKLMSGINYELKSTLHRGRGRESTDYNIVLETIENARGASSRLAYIEEAIENNLVRKEILFEMKNNVLVELERFDDFLSLITQHPEQIDDYQLLSIIEDHNRGNIDIPDATLIPICLLALERDYDKKRGIINDVLGEAYSRTGDIQNALKYFRGGNSKKNGKKNVKYITTLRENTDKMTSEEGVLVLISMLHSGESLMDTEEFNKIANITLKQGDLENRQEILYLQVDAVADVFRNQKGLKFISGNAGEKTFHAYISGMDTSEGAWSPRILTEENYKGSLSRIQEVEAMLSDMKTISPSAEPIRELQRTIDMAHALYKYYIFMENGNEDDAISAIESLVGYPDKGSVWVASMWGNFTPIDSRIVSLYEDHKKPVKGIKYTIGIYNEYLKIRGDHSENHNAFQKNVIGKQLNTFIAQLQEEGEDLHNIMDILEDASVPEEIVKKLEITK